MLSYIAMPHAAAGLRHIQFELRSPVTYGLESAR
jgi:hypothetical protein